MQAGHRGGVTGQVQNTTFAPVGASTSAERSGPNAAGRRSHSQASTSGVTMKCANP